MGNTFNNTITNSGSGKQNITQGDGAIAEQVNNNYNAPQAPVEDLLKIIAALKDELPGLPDEIRAEAEHEVVDAELQARKAEPDKEKMAAALTRAQKVLKAVPGTVAATLPVGKLLGDALIWCGKIAGM